MLATGFQLFQSHECLLTNVHVVLYYVSNPLSQLRLRINYYLDNKKCSSTLLSDRVSCGISNTKVEYFQQSFVGNGSSVTTTEVLTIKLSHLNSISNRCVPEILQSLLLAISNNCK